MEKYDLKKEDVKLHNILYAITTMPYYDMERWLLLEDMPNTKYGEYVIVEGGHCSCYDFDDTDWDAIKYTKEELVKLAKIKVEENYWYKEEKCLWNYILKMFNEKGNY